MALKRVYLWPAGAGKIPLPDIKYIGSPPGLPISIEPGTEEVEMSDKSRRLAFFSGPVDGGWRDFTLGWGYITKAELTTLQNLVALKQILVYQNEFEEAGGAELYDVYIVSFGYEFVRTGIRDLQRFRADMVLRQV